MLRERMVLGDCYILQKCAGYEAYTENWIATAIFSATKFLLRFFKEGLSDEVAVNGVLAETMACYNVRNRYVSDVIELESFSGRYYVSCDYHDEITLASILREGKTSSLEELCRFGVSLAIGLQAFHDAGVVYGNLTDENVFIEIGDYSNIPKVRKPSMLTMALSHPEAYPQGRGYIAPEIRAGGLGSVASDVYSIGIHFVRFVTGKMPYQSDSGPAAGEGASLRFVTNALLRRGVPVSIVRIALRCMMADPNSRYRTCAELVSDIRRAIHEPQNRGDDSRDGIGMADAGKHVSRIPEFSSDDYFNQVARSHESDVQYPARLPEETILKTESIEREELRVREEEKKWSIDDFLTNGKSVVKSVEEELPVPVHVQVPLRDKGLDGNALPDAAAQTDAVAQTDAAALPDIASPIPDAIPMSEIIRSSLLRPEIPRDGAYIQQITPIPNNFGIRAKRRKPARQKRTRIDPVASSSTRLRRSVQSNDIRARTWTRQRVLVSDVPGIVEKAAMRAALGSGGVRYIQEPEAGSKNAQMFTSLADLSSKYLYVNIGSFARFGTADLEDFLLMLRKSLATALAGASKNSLRAIVRAVLRNDRYGIFAQAPLGKILYGANSCAKGDGDREGDDYALTIGRSIVAFGREGRPLVIVARGGERIGRDLNDAISIFSKELVDSRVVFIIFFEHVHVSPWHVLSMLSS